MFSGTIFQVFEPKIAILDSGTRPDGSGTAFCSGSVVSEPGLVVSDLNSEGPRALGPRDQGPGPGTRDQGPGPWVRVPGPGTRDKGPGPWARVPGPGTRAQGPHREHTGNRGAPMLKTQNQEKRRFGNFPADLGGGRPRNGRGIATGTILVVRIPETEPWRFF